MPLRTHVGRAVVVLGIALGLLPAGVVASAAAPHDLPAPTGPDASARVHSFAGDTVLPGVDSRGADQARLRVRAWPGRKITYVDRTRDKDAVRLAVRIWNRSGLKIKFTKTRNARRADLVIRNSRRVPGGCGTGLATLGYPGPRRQAFVNVLAGPDAQGQGCAWPGQTLVLVHELGHVLGLKHNDRTCATMNTSHTNGVAPSQCFTPDPMDFDEAPGRWRCRGPELVDLKRAKRLYGGRISVAQPDDPWCDIVPRMPAAGAPGLVLSEGGVVQLSLTHAPEPALPSFLASSAQQPYYELHRTTGACLPVTPGDSTTLVQRMPWTVPPGGGEPVADYYLLPGVYCYTVLAWDTLGRPAPPSAQLPVSVL